MSTSAFLTIVLFLVLIFVILRYVIPLMSSPDKKKRDELVRDFEQMASRARKVKA